MAIQTISVYLLKECVSSAHDAVKGDVASHSEHAVVAGETTGTLFVANFDETEPNWVRLLASVTEPPVSDRTQSTGALLVLPAAGRWFAITFGHGRHLLDPTVFERRFGLRVALNSVDPARLRGAQARTFNDYALHTHRQLSRLSTVEALELDVERELVTSLAGIPADGDLGKRVDGRDAVRLTADLDARALAEKCAALLVKSQETRYREAFPWIDTVEEVVDPQQIEELERRAAGALGRREFSAFDLFPPELVPAEVVEYRLWPSHGGLVVVEPDSRLLRFPLRGPMSATDAAAAVRRYRLIGLDANAEVVDRWSFWDCLHYEFQQNGVRIVLDGGSWYRVEQTFAAEVDRFAEQLRPSGLDLPAARRGEREDDYNARAAGSEHLALLDRDLIRLPGQTPIEACDLFSDRRHFVHVKHRKGGSGPFSHLLAQASVSAELLLMESDFRDQLRTKLSAAGFDGVLDDPVDASSCAVVLALITKASSPGYAARGLPFFSKVALRQVVRRLRAMGFSVYVDEIPTPVTTPRRVRPSAARSAAGSGGAPASRRAKSPRAVNRL